MVYQSAPMKYTPVAASNVIALPLFWKGWYIVVAILSFFFFALAIFELIHIYWNASRDGANNPSLNDWK